MDFFFQQNHDAKPNSKLCRGYLEHKETKGMLKHVVVPLEPIKLLKEELDRNVRSNCPSSQEDTRKALREI